MDKTSNSSEPFDSGYTVTHLEDYKNNVAYTNMTDIASKQFYNLKGTIERID